MLPGVKGEESGATVSIYGEGERNMIKKEHLAEWRESVQMVSGYIIVLEWLTNNSRIKKRSWLNVFPYHKIFFRFRMEVTCFTLLSRL